MEVKGKVEFNGFTVIYAFPESKTSINGGISVDSHPLSNLSGLFQRTIILTRYGEHFGISGSIIYSWDSIRIGSYT